MSDDLTISGSGSSAIATDELYASAQSLHRLATEAASLHLLLISIDDLVSMRTLLGADAPASAARAESDIHQARMVIVEIEAAARALAWALGTAADGYGFVEHVIGKVGVGLSGQLGGLLGRFLPGALLLSSRGILSALGGGAAAVAVQGGPDEALANLKSFAHGHNELTTNPVTVSLVRNAAMSADDVLMGASGVPPALATILGDSGLGIVGLALAAGTLQGMTRPVGVLAETSVRATSIEPRPVDGAPTGYADRLSRVPHPEADGGPQVVIEKYSTPGHPDRFEVYVAGTVDFSPIAGSEPWDMTSNVSNAAGHGGGSYESVVAAMKLAGIQDTNPVQFTGYSQGGAIAAMLAASGDYDAQGVTTFGAPTGQVPIPESIPAVLVEHSDDIVPAFGGVQANQHAVIVERAVFAGHEIPRDLAFPAHNIDRYLETARLMDNASSDQLTGAAARLDRFGATATTVTSTGYTFERVPPSGSSGNR